MQSGIKSKTTEIIWAFSNQRVLNMTEQLPEYQSEMERNKLNLQTVSSDGREHKQNSGLCSHSCFNDRHVCSE